MGRLWDNAVKPYLVGRVTTMVGLEDEEPGSRGSPLLGSSFMARVIRYGQERWRSDVRCSRRTTTQFLRTLLPSGQESNTLLLVTSLHDGKTRAWSGKRKDDTEVGKKQLAAQRRLCINTGARHSTVSTWL
ncbi:hypothetical protein HPB50_021916 [Hyalomma asiaticum]|uniref:Uncharacterized protein n=1 Tax=Hyalomma asiaticum TaxID=266040 RepID=A0ACB7SZ46_HYAAI|nr:hypothetical protein HPB50_021916 [Hyalomma asiaticum]